MVDEHDQREDERNGQKRGDDCDARGGGAENGDLVGDPRDLRIVLVQTARDVEREVLQKIAHADGRDHDGHTRRGTQRLIRHALDGEAEQDGEHDHQRNGCVERHRRGEVDHQKTRDHENIAVGEVDKAQDAVDHRVADGDKGVLSAHRDSRQEIRQNGAG